jgi:polyisoprenoid-binding protein YceI
MKRSCFLSICLLILAGGLLSQPVYLTRSGTASFVSNAPLEIIKAESKSVSGAIDLADNEFIFTIDNNSFKGFNSALQQEHFYENYMETQLYPTSSFKGKIIEKIDVNSTLEQEVRAKGILDIHGVSQERIIKGTVKIIGDKLQLKADFTVLLEDHLIKIPKVVNQKIAETIEVSIIAELNRQKN